MDTVGYLIMVVDADSAARNNRNLTNLRQINQLFERPYTTIPYMGAGSVKELLI